MKKSHAARSWIYPALTLTLPATQPVLAEGEGPQQTAYAEDETPVIIVTPQKREQYLQDVPIVVTPVSEALLRESGVRNIKDATILTPGLTITSTQNETATTARIRGVGTVGDNAGLESSVGIVIDGVYRPRNGVSFGDIGELQQIEVIKGPQGTLFGKNTSAGVITLTTKAPEFEFQAGGELSGGNYGTKEVSAFITGPLLGHELAGRLYVSNDQHDGFNTVLTGNGPRTLGEDDDRDQYTVRGQLAFRPNGGLFMRLIGDYSKHDENCCGSVQVNSGASAALIDALSPDSGVANPINPSARVAYLNRASPQSIRDNGVSLEANWDVPVITGATLTSISAYRNWKAVNGLDADFTSADIWYRAPDGSFGNEFDQITQEVRLAGVSGRLNWLGGVFYAHETLDSRQSITAGSVFEPYYSLLFTNGQSTALISTLTGLAQGQSYPLGSTGVDRFNQISDSYAVFTNNSFAVTDQLETTVGLRYTREDKSVDSTYANAGGASTACQILRGQLAQVTTAVGSALVPSFYNLGCGAFADPVFNSFTSSQKLSQNNVSGTAKVAYKLTPELMSYLSYTRGYKAGGFNLDRELIQSATLGAADPNTQADSNTSFAAETVTSYELGFKTSWLERAVLLDFALFSQRFNNFQLSVFRGNGFIATTVPKVTSRGVDVDVYWFGLQRALTLQAGVAYADTAYGNFAATSFIPTRLPGSQLAFAPLFSGTAAAIYERPFTDTLRYRVSVAGKATSKFNTGSDLNPGKVQGAYGILNARVGVGSISNRWMLEAYVQNLTNKNYYQVIIDAPLQPNSLNGFLGDPRTYGLTLRVNY